MVMQRKFASKTDVTGLLRKDLHATFSPRERRFSVQAKANDTLFIGWKDGPLPEQVKAIVKSYQFHYENDSYLDIGGEQYYSPFTRVSYERTLSESVLRDMVERYCNFHRYTKPEVKMREDGSASILVRYTLPSKISVGTIVIDLLKQIDFTSPQIEEVLSHAVEQTRPQTFGMCDFCGRMDIDTAHFVRLSFVQGDFDTCIECMTQEMMTLTKDDLAAPDESEVGQLAAALKEAHEIVPMQTARTVRREQPTTTCDTLGRPYPLLRRDSEYENVSWLKFPAKNEWGIPPRTVLDALKREKWGFGGRRKEWRHANKYQLPPEEVYQEYAFVIEEDTRVDYAVERPERLADAGDRHETNANHYAEASNRVVDERLSTGIVIHGTKTSRSMEVAQRKAERYKERATSEDQIAEWCRSHSVSSRRHQRKRKGNAGVVYRRLEGYRTERRKLVKDYQEAVEMAVYTVKKGIQDRWYNKTPEQLQEMKARRDDRLSVLDPMIAQDEVLLESLGGVAGYEVKIEKGDTVWFSRHYGMKIVEKVNKKSLTIWDDYGNPEQHRFQRNVPLDEFSHIIKKADGTEVETYEQMLKRYKLLKNNPVTYASSPKEERIFKVDELAEVELPYSNPDNVFLTPPNVANQLFDLVGSIPQGRWLEPQAGPGVLAEQMEAYRRLAGYINTKIETGDINPDFVQILREKKFEIAYEGDYLDFWPEELFTFIATNPPFASPGKRWAWFEHIMHSLEMLEDGGLLLAILPMSFFSDDTRITALREMVEVQGDYVKLPPGAFNEAGTQIPVVLIAIWK